MVGLGLALALLGPAPGPPPPPSPANALALAQARLPAGSGAVRVLGVVGERSGGGWHFWVWLGYRWHGRLSGETVLLPAPPVGAVLPRPPSPAEYAGSPGPVAAQRALALSAASGCVVFPARGGSCAAFPGG